MGTGNAGTRGEREMQRQAAEIAKATGTGAFGHDSIGAVMLKYDKNGDGVFSVSEVREIVHDVVEQQSLNKQLKKTVVLMVFLLLVMLGALVGTSVTGAVIGGEVCRRGNGGGMHMAP